MADWKLLPCHMMGEKSQALTTAKKHVRASEINKMVAQWNNMGKQKDTRVKRSSTPSGCPV